MFHNGTGQRNFNKMQLKCLVIQELDYHSENESEPASLIFFLSNQCTIGRAGGQNVG